MLINSVKTNFLTLKTSTKYESTATKTQQDFCGTKWFVGNK